MWVYGNTDLGDFYRDRLTLRQVWVRIKALPPEAPLLGVIESINNDAAAETKRREVEETLARFRR